MAIAILNIYLLVYNTEVCIQIYNWVKYIPILQILKFLPTLWSTSPTRVLLPRVSLVPRQSSETKGSLILCPNNWELQALALEHRLSPTGGGGGCVIGSRQWGEVLAGLGSVVLILVFQPEALGAHLCTWPATAILNCSVMRVLLHVAHGAEMLAQTFHTGNSGLKGWVQGLWTQLPVSKWN